MQLTNFAAWIPEEKAKLTVAAAPFPDCGDNEVIIKNHAVAINPVDWKIQSSGGFGLRYPYILGEDVAGEIIEVGVNIKHLKVGQRVIAHALGVGAGNPAKGGFQIYPLLSSATVAVLPDSLPFEAAAVLPLSISTAAAGLYMKSTLGLRYPYLDSKLLVTDAISKKTKTLLLWGGSSSVGSSVIQLATASGYAVVTTASPSNYDYCKSLGATLVLDYHNPDIVQILICLLQETKLVGAYDAIGSDVTVSQCAFILHALGGGKVASVVSAPESLEKDVEVVRIGSGNIVSQEPDVAKGVWGDYVPAALEAGKLLAKPKELVVGKGLDSVQKGLDTQKKGVSARKVVVRL